MMTIKPLNNTYNITLDEAKDIVREIQRTINNAAKCPLSVHLVPVVEMPKLGLEALLMVALDAVKHEHD